jgi:hypothetical protein
LIAFGVSLPGPARATPPRPQNALEPYRIGRNLSRRIQIRRFRHQVVPAAVKQADGWARDDLSPAEASRWRRLQKQAADTLVGFCRGLGIDLDRSKTFSHHLKLPGIRGFPWGLTTLSGESGAAFVQTNARMVRTEPDAVVLRSMVHELVHSNLSRNEVKVSRRRKLLQSGFGFDHIVRVGSSTSTDIQTILDAVRTNRTSALTRPHRRLLKHYRLAAASHQISPAEALEYELFSRRHEPNKPVMVQRWLKKQVDTVAFDEAVTEFLAVMAVDRSRFEQLSSPAYREPARKLLRLHDSLPGAQRQRFLSTLIQAKRAGNVRPIIDAIARSPAGVRLSPRELLKLDFRRLGL